MDPVSKMSEDYLYDNKLLIELAEKRVIEKLGLTEKEVVYAKAFETSKIMEMKKIRKQLQEHVQRNKKYTFWDYLFCRFD